MRKVAPFRVEILWLHHIARKHDSFIVSRHYGAILSNAFVITTCESSGGQSFQAIATDSPKDMETLLKLGMERHSESADAPPVFRLTVRSYVLQGFTYCYGDEIPGQLHVGSLLQTAVATSSGQSTLIEVEAISEQQCAGRVAELQKLLEGLIEVPTARLLPLRTTSDPAAQTPLVEKAENISAICATYPYFIQLRLNRWPPSQPQSQQPRQQSPVQSHSQQAQQSQVQQQTSRFSHQASGHKLPASAVHRQLIAAHIPHPDVAQQRQQQQQQLPQQQQQQQTKQQQMQQIQTQLPPGVAFVQSAYAQPNFVSSSVPTLTFPGMLPSHTVPQYPVGGAMYFVSTTSPSITQQQPSQAQPQPQQYYSLQGPS